jgi:copper homeostasis protein
MKRVVEIVCCSVEDCAAAVKAGAQRIELCSAIELGGLTPSIGLQYLATEEVSVPIISMLRPRAGGFCYTDAELATMIWDARNLRESAGFAFGILTSDCQIDIDACKLLARRMGTGLNRREMVFHRAFDLVPDPFEAMEILIDIGFERILTSGKAPRAADGTDLLRRLIDKADGRIEIMPGGGVRSSNVDQVLATGCNSVHLAPRRAAADGAMEVDPEEVSAVVQICRSHL